MHQLVLSSAWTDLRHFACYGYDDSGTETDAGVSKSEEDPVESVVPTIDTQCRRAGSEYREHLLDL